MSTNVLGPRALATTLTANGAAAPGKHTPGDATSAPITVTLPAASSANAGATVSIEKTDSSTNAVTISGSIRGVGSSTLTLALQRESIEFLADSTGSWWPIAGHKTLGSLDTRNDSRYVALANGTPPALVRPVTVAYAATVTPNAATTDVLNVGALTGNITLANPSGSPVDGQVLRLRMSQDATGSRTVSFGTAYAFGTDVTSSLIPSAASSKWEMLFTWNATDSKWRAGAIIRGF